MLCRISISMLASLGNARHQECTPNSLEVRPRPAALTGVKGEVEENGRNSVAKCKYNI